ncbi:2-keto-4-pentenoate hydratase/2-oxohepta-3-ene-1,7-dioic acid hydratase in catechol pathway [Wenyingzhuangia heitensis]|uniref:2-keto-4-pentenoate hydratase/2-oxohepta-3-ene-1,7-dioic acid hydratase in catechol pathway n=1 Tax=Wenyingzhuangia heitensis TaxID=1487859 RepID=A0ABX0UG46_9FLAO|nr:fumarylacetoacetate hydrolase family protein [Wenyingzhuangia heitensis]NIJ46506.1 2-keto-4-pentenoate hydratase/2-oxohepta-3-ene-1,7-dioic acid hydratase in catechol pathway [Wenyingzhuangia heitensis]
MKIICIGMNYTEHIKEFDRDFIPTEPVVFLKPDSAVLPKKNPFVIPVFSNRVEYEIEVLVKINKVGKHIGERFAHKYYDEIGLGIDFTARDVQLELKKNGHPWEKAKGFDGSAIIGESFLPKEQFTDLNNINFRLEKNEEQVQVGNTKDMIFKIDEIIAYISTIYTLKKGDIIFTGTPSGVGPVAKGDVLRGYLEDEKLIDIKVR